MPVFKRAKRAKKRPKKEPKDKDYIVGTQRKHLQWKASDSTTNQGDRRQQDSTGIKKRRLAPHLGISLKSHGQAIPSRKTDTEPGSCTDGQKG